MAVKMNLVVQLNRMPTNRQLTIDEPNMFLASYFSPAAKTRRLARVSADAAAVADAFAAYKSSEAEFSSLGLTHELETRRIEPWPGQRHSEMSSLVPRRASEQSFVV